MFVAYSVEGVAEALEYGDVHANHTRIFGLHLLVVTLHPQVPDMSHTHTHTHTHTQNARLNEI